MRFLETNTYKSFEMFNFLIMCVYSVLVYNYLVILAFSIILTSLELLHDVLPYVHAEEFVSL